MADDAIAGLPAESAGTVHVRSLESVSCARMTPATRDGAQILLARFLRDDAHYLASSAAYGDGGSEALTRALDLFLAHPEIGFVWVAEAGAAASAKVVGACVVCHAISTSRGTLVAKLDDVTIHDDWRGRGIGGAMLEALGLHLRARGITRIDTACHRDNSHAWRFYERLGFRALDEERISLLLDGG